MPRHTPLKSDYELKQELIAARLQEISDLEAKETLAGSGPAASGALQAERERLVARSDELIDQEQKRIQDKQK